MGLLFVAKLFAWSVTDMTDNRIQISVFKHSKESFLSMLDEKDIKYIERPWPEEVIVGAGETFDIIQAVGEASPFLGALAYVIVTWIKARASRKIVLQTKDKKVFHIEGFSVGEVEKILAQVESFMVIDTKPLENEKHSDDKMSSNLACK